MLRSSIAVFLLIFMSLVVISGSAHSASSTSRKFMEGKGAKFVTKSELYTRLHGESKSPVSHTYACGDQICMCVGGHDCVTMIIADVCKVETFECWDDPEGERICTCAPAPEGKL
jgi:hypothetical protein